jgi:hypothetical protein
LIDKDKLDEEMEFLWSEVYGQFVELSPITVTAKERYKERYE